jgi:phospholipase/carboxylesterase
LQVSEILPALVAEPTGDVTGSVIWLHGLGADGHDFAPILPHLPLGELGVRVVLPHAPSQPVTINGGMSMPAWYDIRPTDGPARHDEAGIRASAVAIDALIANERASLPAERIAVVGFSQGGAMALHCGLRASERLAGVAALSTYLLLPEATEGERSAANAETPIFQAHGTHDAVVAPARGAHARDWLLERGYALAWHDYPMGHEVCLEEIAELGSWFRSIFA